MLLGGNGSKGKSQEDLEAVCMETKEGFLKIGI